MMNYEELPLPQSQREEIHQLLINTSEKQGNIDCESILRSLQELLTDNIESQSCFEEIVFPILKSCLNTPNPEAALNNFSRFTHVTFNRKCIYQLFRDAPFLIPTVMFTFGASSYLSEILIRNPIYFYDIIDSSVMETPKSRDTMYHELFTSINRFREVEQKLRIIRRYKRRESLRIALRDLLQDANVETTTLELANLAEAALQNCYEIGCSQMKPKYGTPLNEDGKSPCSFAIIGMGKLGGYELNFSSDIDLIFVYSDEGKTDKGIDNSEYYSRLCEFIIQAMSDVTADGYVFRVDIRLRPESSAGVIIRSMESYESYYEGWGDLWERQALIKARPVAGDMAFGEEFIRMIQPFVYQRYLDGVTLNEIKNDIRNTKTRIEERLLGERIEIEKHVKLGPGAIRDIEFTVQCLQMIHGGQRRSLCSQNTLETLAALKTNKLLESEDVDVLSDAYRFLRRVENAIQIESDQQRYSIPAKLDEATQLACRLGYQVEAHELFQKDYQKHTAQVREIFEKVMNVTDPEQLDIAVLINQDDSDQIDQKLGQFGFENTRNAHRLLRQLANGGEGQQFSPSVRRTFFKLAPALLKCVSDAPDPDMALRYFEAFAAKVGARSSYYTMFMERQGALEAIISVCGASLYLADLLIASPELFDLLTVSTFTESPKTLVQKHEEVNQILKNTGESQGLSSLRRYKNDEIWRIALRNILGKADLPTTTEELSDLAEAILQGIYRQVDFQLQKEHGTPASNNGAPGTFAIIAMGKFGGRDLNFSSDLDIMYVYTEDGKTSKGMPNSEYFSILGLELVNQLSGNHGMTVYELDLRLRPYGTGGAIALPLNGYQNYYDNSAEIWERQALTRARVIAGDIEGLGNRYMEMAHSFCYSHPLTSEEITQIVHTRQRKETQVARKTKSRRRRSGKAQKSTANVKSGYGGLVDIEFAVQTLQLIHGTQNKSIRESNTLIAIDRLFEIGVLTETQRKGLSESYQYLRSVENALRIVHDRALDALPTNRTELLQLARRLGYEETEDTSIVETFLQDYGKWTEKTRTLFNEILLN